MENVDLLNIECCMMYVYLSYKQVHHVTDTSHDRHITWQLQHMTGTSHDRYIKWQLHHMTGTSHDRYITWQVHHMTCTSHDIYITWHVHHMTCTSHDRYITWQVHHIARIVYCILYITCMWILFSSKYSSRLVELPFVDILSERTLYMLPVFNIKAWTQVNCEVLCVCM